MTNNTKRTIIKRKLNTILVVCLIIQTLLIAAISFFAWRKLKYYAGIISAVYNDLYDFVSPGKDNGPSELALTVKKLGDIIAMELKTTLMGKISGEVRAVKALENDIIQDQISSESPLLGALSGSKLGKRLIGNPNILQSLLPLLSNISPISGARAGGNHTTTGRPRFNLG